MEVMEMACYMRYKLEGGEIKEKYHHLFIIINATFLSRSVRGHLSTKLRCPKQRCYNVKLRCCCFPAYGGERMDTNPPRIIDEKQ